MCVVLRIGKKEEPVVEHIKEGLNPIQRALFFQALPSTFLQLNQLAVVVSEYYVRRTDEKTSIFGVNV
jgi:hypothetical protein